MWPVLHCFPSGWLHTRVAELSDWQLSATVIAFSLRSRSRKNRIIVAAGSEWKKKKSGKEKSIKNHFFPPFQARCAESEMKAQVSCLKYFRILYLEEAKTYF